MFAIIYVCLYMQIQYRVKIFPQLINSRRFPLFKNAPNPPAVSPATQWKDPGISPAYFWSLHTYWYRYPLKLL